MAEQESLNQTKSIAYYFRTIHFIFDKMFNAKLKEFDLTRSQFEVLKFISLSKESSIIQRDIEYFFHISNPTVTGILNRLEQKDLIVRIKDDKDKRIHTIHITPKAKEILKEIYSRKPRLDEVIADILGPEKTKELENLLMDLMQGLTKEGEMHA